MAKKKNNDLPASLRDKKPIIVSSISQPLVEYAHCLKAMGINFRTHLYREKQFTMDNGETWHDLTDDTEAIIFAKIQNECFYFNPALDGKGRYKAITTSESNRRTLLKAIASGNLHSPLEEWLQTIEPQPFTDVSPSNHPANLIKMVFEPAFDRRITDNYDQRAIDQFCLDWLCLVGKGSYLRTTRRGTPDASFQFLPTIVGDQGCGKGTFIRGLLPAHLRKELAGDGLNFSSKVADLLIACQKFSIVECDELAGFRRKDVNDLKSFISSENMSIRPAYGRNQIIIHRHHIIIATINDFDFLANDPTGQRRYPILVVTFKQGWNEADVRRHMWTIMEKAHHDFWGYIKYLVEIKGELASYEHWATTSREIREKLCNIHERRPLSVERALDELTHPDPDFNTGSNYLTPDQKEIGIFFDVPADCQEPSVMKLLPLEIVKHYSRDLIAKTMKRMGWKNGELTPIGDSRRYLKIPPPKKIITSNLIHRRVLPKDKPKPEEPQSISRYVTDTPSKHTQYIDEINRKNRERKSALDKLISTLDAPANMSEEDIRRFAQKYGDETQSIFDSLRRNDK